MFKTQNVYDTAASLINIKFDILKEKSTIANLKIKVLIYTIFKRMINKSLLKKHIKTKKLDMRKSCDAFCFDKQKHQKEN